MLLDRSFLSSFLNTETGAPQMLYLTKLSHILEMNLKITKQLTSDANINADIPYINI